MTVAPQFVLASSSPRRQGFLADLGFSFVVDAADIDETPLRGEDPRTYVTRVALAKLAAVAARHPQKVVLAADTTVAVGRRILGKPEDAADAARMLRLMSGRRHHVLSTVAVMKADGTPRHVTTQTHVKVRPLTEKMIAAYVATPKNWQGVAGAYGLQTAVGAALIVGMNGSVSGVIGLPLVETTNLLRSAGIDV